MVSGWFEEIRVQSAEVAILTMLTVFKSVSEFALHQYVHCYDLKVGCYSFYAALDELKRNATVKEIRNMFGSRYFQLTPVAEFA